MRILPALSLLLACLAGVILAVPEAAAQGAPSGSQLLPMEDVGDPQTLIPERRPQTFSSTETRLPGGRVTEIEVQSGASRYYMQPQTATGGARSESGQTARWNILNFDLRRPESGRADRAPEAVAAPVPPPPRAD